MYFIYIRLTFKEFEQQNIQKRKQMFSTPQSKAYFNQEVVKGKIIAQQLSLVSQIQEKLHECKSKVMEITMMIGSAQQDNEKCMQNLKEIQEDISNTHQTVFISNDNFRLEVSLRKEIKELDHLFFKKIMRQYEKNIKELKQDLLNIESEVQKLQKMGYFPYVENPSKNNMAGIKSRFMSKNQERIKLQSRLRGIDANPNIQRKIEIVRDKYLHHINQENNEYINELEARANKSNDQKIQEENKVGYLNSWKTMNNQDTLGGLDCSGELKKLGKIEKQCVEELIKLELSLHQYKNLKINYFYRENKKKIEDMTAQNKKLKEGIHHHKKIMQYQHRERIVRNGDQFLVREEAIDFLRDMSQDLKKRLQNRNLYMVIIQGIKLGRSISEPALLPSQKAQSMKNQNPNIFRQIGNKLTDSFLDQCSYLITDRFIIDEEEIDQTVIV